MKKVKEITKKEKFWDSFWFYRIYEDDDGMKRIYFQSHVTRVDRGKDYLSWVIFSYLDCEDCTLKELLEWDVFYGRSKILCDPYEDEYEPYDCLKRVNEIMISGDPEGRYRLDIIDITEDTECGYYFGL